LNPALPGPPRALPVVVIGGYLGAGKTTLLNHLLHQAAGRRIAVLVNDFGEVNIDADLIVGAEAGVLSLAGGCLCCSFGDDLVGTLNGLHRRSPPPDLVLIELSGVALPAAVVRSARLAAGVEVVGTLVVADAADIRRQAGDRYVGDTVLQQLRDADWLLLNKPDLVDAATLEALQSWLAGDHPGARLMACAAQALPAELVLGWHDQPDDPPRQAGDCAEVDGGDGGDGGGDSEGDTIARFDARPIGGSARRLQPATSLFVSQSLPLPPGTDLAALGRALAAPDSGVLRAKALLAPADSAAGALLQVAGGRWQLTPATVRGDGRLVLIGLRDRLNFDMRPWAGGR
jgi:G3E family GTPase